jgi:hypothetical protein
VGIASRFQALIVTIVGAEAAHAAAPAPQVRRRVRYDLRAGSPDVSVMRATASRDS